MGTVAGLRAMHSIGAAPELIYVDADHSFEGCLADLEACAALFPEALIVGDDWCWPSVRAAVDSFMKSRRGHRLYSAPQGQNWYYIRRGPSRCESAAQVAEAALVGPQPKRRRYVEFTPGEQSRDSSHETRHTDTLVPSSSVNQNE